MKDVGYYFELQQALEKSYQKRKGNWSSPREVAGYTDESVTLASMRDLVKKGMATEKRPSQKVFKPRKGAAGPGGSGILGFDPYRSPEGWQSPDGGPRVTKPDYTVPTDDSGPRLGDTLGRGIGIAVLGGMGGSAAPAAGGATGTGTVGTHMVM